MAQDPGDQEIPPVNFPAIAKRRGRRRGFIPKGWKQVQLAQGDLNRDGKPDFAMVMRMDSAANRIAAELEPRDALRHQSVDADRGLPRRRRL